MAAAKSPPAAELKAMRHRFARIAFVKHRGPVGVLICIHRAGIQQQQLTLFARLIVLQVVEHTRVFASGDNRIIGKTAAPANELMGKLRLDLGFRYAGLGKFADAFERREFAFTPNRTRDFTNQECSRSLDAQPQRPESQRSYVKRTGRSAHMRTQDILSRTLTSIPVPFPRSLGIVNR
jgi:hypothetical protein